MRSIKSIDGAIRPARPAKWKRVIRRRGAFVCAARFARNKSAIRNEMVRELYDAPVSRACPPLSPRGFTYPDILQPAAAIDRESRVSHVVMRKRTCSRLFLTLLRFSSLEARMDAPRHSGEEMPPRSRAMSLPWRGLPSAFSEAAGPKVSGGGSGGIERLSRFFCEPISFHFARI